MSESLNRRVKDYLEQGRVMQLATSVGGQPWVCTVYYVVDKNSNLYWLSLPSRRHSKEVEKNPNVAVTIPIKFDLPVVGIQAEGTVSKVTDANKIKLIMESYISKYAVGQSFHENFIKQKNQHEMYVFNPGKIVLFDEANSAEDQIG